LHQRFVGRVRFDAAEDEPGTLTERGNLTFAENDLCGVLKREVLHEILLL
jgi:hypothetical protein